MVHDPNEMQEELQRWVKANNAWVIHGHHHNNNLRAHPFINGAARSINVSAEVVGYRPVSLTYLLSLNLNTIARMDTVGSIPQHH